MADLEALFTAWRGGDRDAGQGFIETTFGEIHRFFASKGGNEVEELVQETFTRLATAKDNFRGQCKPRTYLFGIAMNVLREHYRSKTRKNIDIEDVSVRDLGAGPSTLRWRRREDELLLEELRSLPLQMQAVLELRYWDGFSRREIAQILGVPEGTVGSRIERARARLRDAFEGRAHEHVPADPTDGDLDGWAERIRKSVPLEQGS